jgi:NAD(P)-dependent dehydrogenase (short-subunit alcohol dehydrogenase family)
MIENSFRLDGRIALITGSGRGIGLGMAQALASAGCAVAIQDIDLEVAQRQADAINATGGRAMAFGGDIADTTLAARLVPQVVAALGGIHILINNAAVQTEKPWLDLSLADVERDWRANLLAPLLLCQQVAPNFKNQQWGRIINLGSIQQTGGYSGMLAYAMSKAALVKMTQAIARDLARWQVTANLLAPGWFNTHRNRDYLRTEQEVQEHGRHIPLGRLGTIHDCNGITLTLCSQAGEYITGQVIFVDGGMSLR